MFAHGRWGVALFLVSLSTQDARAATLNLFSDAADLAEFQVTSAADANSVVVDGLSSPPSALDGDALRIFDQDSGGRTTLRWRPSEANTDGFRMSFDFLTDPTSTGRVMLRGGNDAASMAGIAGAGLSLELNADGSVLYPFDDGGVRVSETSAPLGAGVRIAVSLVVNSAISGDLAYEAPSGLMALGPQKYDLYLNGKAVALGRDLLNSSSGFDGALGLQDFWFLSGTSSAETGIEQQVDNWAFHTGNEISFVPEPASWAIGVWVAFVTLGCRRHEMAVPGHR